MALLLQVGWFAAVLPAAHGSAWLGPAVILLLCAIHLGWLSAEPRLEARAMVWLGAFGMVADSSLLAVDAIELAANPWPPVSPPWMVALWGHFATAPVGPFAWLRRRPWTAAALGFVAGPLAYWAGGRLGALAWPRGVGFGAITVAVVWAFAVPLAVRLTAPRRSR